MIWLTRMECGINRISSMHSRDLQLNNDEKNLKIVPTGRRKAAYLQSVLAQHEAALFPRDASTDAEHTGIHAM